MTIAITFFVLGICQGFILTDWMHDKKSLKLKKK